MSKEEQPYQLDPLLSTPRLQTLSVKVHLIYLYISRNTRVHVFLDLRPQEIYLGLKHVLSKLEFLFKL